MSTSPQEVEGSRQSLLNTLRLGHDQRPRLETGKLNLDKGSLVSSDAPQLAGGGNQLLTYTSPSEVNFCNRPQTPTGMAPSSVRKEQVPGVMAAQPLLALNTFTCLLNSGAICCNTPTRLL